MRASDLWPHGGSMSLDLAQRMVSQQRQLVDGRASSIPPGGELVSGPYMMADIKVGQLVGRVSQIIGEFQRNSEADKQELEKQVRSSRAHADSKLGKLEARLKACEDKVAGQERRLDGGAPSDRGAERVAQEALLAAREVRSEVGSGLKQAQAEWRSILLEDQAARRQEVQHVSQDVVQLKALMTQAIGRIEQGEMRLDDEEQRTTRLEDAQARSAGAGPPPWFAKLEGLVHGVEARLDGMHADLEAQLGRAQADFDTLRRRVEAAPGARDEALRGLEAAVERAVAERFEGAGRPSAAGAGFCGAPAGALGPGAALLQSQMREHLRRLDDTESRVAAMRVRLDGLDGRFCGMEGRLEAAGLQAVEAAQQVAAQQREDILSEVECQLSILRQTVKTLSGWCEELMYDYRQALRGRAAR